MPRLRCFFGLLGFTPGKRVVVHNVIVHVSLFMGFSVHLPSIIRHYTSYLMGFSCTDTCHWHEKNPDEVGDHPHASPCLFEVYEFDTSQ